MVSGMKLEDLGYNTYIENYRKELGLEAFQVARVISEHRERYVVRTDKSEYHAEIIGNLRYSSNKRSDLPSVGDWVTISEYDEDKVLIHTVFPRKTVIERQAVGKPGEKQIIASNIDYAFIVLAVDRDFNINRAERYLTICYDANVKPIIIINKIDLIEEPELKSIRGKLLERIRQLPIIFISNETQAGYDDLYSIIEKGKTYCLLGSSGVGKSTLLNNIAGQSVMKTDSISLSTNKGRHVTSHRELFIVNNGGILIDNPGMREIGIGNAETGMEITFDTIIELSDQCKFKNCTHHHESGCAVIEAVDNGEIEMAFYKNYLKMEREKAHFESDVAEKRKKDKDFGKMIKNYKKLRKKNKF